MLVFNNQETAVKVKFNPNTGNIKQTLKQVMKYNTGRLLPQSNTADSFVSSVSKNVNRKNCSNDYITMAAAIADYAKYGFKSAESLKLMSKYCMEGGLVYIPALFLALRMYKELGGDGSSDKDNFIFNSCERNFINYLDSMKTNKRFDTDKVKLAQKIEAPFNFLKFQSTLDELKVKKKDYPVINEALDNVSSIFLVRDGLYFLNETHKPYKHILDMVNLYKKLQENSGNICPENIAIRCYDIPEQSLEFYTPEVIRALDGMYPGEFHPDSMNVAKAIKQDVLKFSSLYSKFNNLRFITSVMINTDEKTKCHYVQGVVQDLYAGSADLEIKAYTRDGELLYNNKIHIDNTQAEPVVMKSHIEDYKSNSIIDRVFERKIETVDIVKEQTITRKTPDGQIIRKEYYKQSQLPGVFDVFYAYPDGDVEVVSRGVEEPITGEKVKKMHVTSAGGVSGKTDYVETLKGDSSYKFSITAPDGKELLSRTVLKKVIDDNHIISIVDGREYSIELGDKNITVIRLQDGKPCGKKYYLKRVEGENKKARPAVKSLGGAVNALKQTPAEFIIDLIRRKVIVEDTNSAGASFQPDKNTILLDLDNTGSGFVLTHEGTHSADLEKLSYGQSFKYNLSTDKSLRKVMKKELMSVIKTEPSVILERDMNYYFMFTNKNRGECEVLADAGALFNTAPDKTSVALRVFELLRNFPETIAKCAEILTQHHRNS